MAAHRALIAVENRARSEALQVQLALREREEVRQRWGDLLPTSLDLIRHLRITADVGFAERVAVALKAERDEGRKSLVEERVTLIDQVMLIGEQLEFPAMATEMFEFEVASAVFCWSASIEELCLVREALHLKVQANTGRLR